MPGTLYVIATPIGNLDDMTFRAVRLLREADRIACEDTRVTRVLCQHFGVDAPLLRHDAHNEEESTRGLLALLDEGVTVALVSDAGTPALSDPGARLVRAARDAGHVVVPVPGPSALLAAASASGLPLEPLTFHGFVPKKPGRRRAALGALGPGTHAFFCPARDLKAVVADLPAGCEVVVARELTKLYESWYRGDRQQVLAALEVEGADKGEAVLLVRSGTGASEPSDEVLVAALGEALAAGAKLKLASTQVATRLGVSKRRVYQLGLGQPGLGQPLGADEQP